MCLKLKIESVVWNDALLNYGQSVCWFSHKGWGSTEAGPSSGEEDRFCMVEGKISVTWDKIGVSVDTESQGF